MPLNRDEILKATQGLRVADVVDALDWIGQRDVGHVDPAVRPLWSGTHMVGLAITTRYIPVTDPMPTMTEEEYDRFTSNWYGKICPYPILDQVRPGDVIVVDASGTRVGLWGSSNTLSAINKGARGIVTDGGCRDTYEVALQKCPVFSRHIARTMVQGRLKLASMGEPVLVGGVWISPGDLVVGDDDGVVAVSQANMERVIARARKVLDADKRDRRKLYEQGGRKPDETVQ